jgi:hypothetical protein
VVAGLGIAGGHILVEFVDIAVVGVVFH